MVEKLSRHFRLSAEARRLMGLLAEKMGVSHTAVIEIAIRKLAGLEKVDGPREP